MRVQQVQLTGSDIGLGRGNFCQGLASVGALLHGVNKRAGRTTDTNQHDSRHSSERRISVEYGTALHHRAAHAYELPHRHMHLTGGNQCTTFEAHRCTARCPIPLQTIVLLSNPLLDSNQLTTARPARKHSPQHGGAGVPRRVVRKAYPPTPTPWAHSHSIGRATGWCTNAKHPLWTQSPHKHVQ